MDAVLNVALGAIVALLICVVWRWRWLKERRTLASFANSSASRFDTQHFGDEDDQTYSGRVISRLRSILIEGRVEIHWEFRPEYIHQGFILSAKSRRNDGEWQVLAMEPFEDSGSWIECFNYGESRSYLFTVKKRYWFFFGLFGEAPDEIVYDQISFSVRKGKYLKERKELIRDRRELLGEVKEYVRAEQDLRQLMRGTEPSKPKLPSKETPIQKLAKRRAAQTELAAYLEEQTAAINAQSTWSPERKAQEIQLLHETVAEIALEE